MTVLLSRVRRRGNTGGGGRRRSGNYRRYRLLSYWQTACTRVISPQGSRVTTQMCPVTTTLERTLSRGLPINMECRQLQQWVRIALPSNNKVACMRRRVTKYMVFYLLSVGYHTSGPIKDGASFGWYPHHMTGTLATTTVIKLPHDFFLPINQSRVRRQVAQRNFNT